MKIEFRKAPNTEKDFSTSSASVKLEGTFCKISSHLVKVIANMTGTTQVNCCRCGNEETITINEKLNLLLSDGVYDNKKSEDLVIEVENNTIDFEDLVNGEVASLCSEYHICQECSEDDSNFEKEF